MTGLGLPARVDSNRFIHADAELPQLGRSLTKINHKQPMSPTPTSQVSDTEPGQLLKELEQRQDDVLAQLDALDAKLEEVLRGLGDTDQDEVSQDLV